MINIKKIKPMFTSVVTTMERYGEDELLSSGIVDTKKMRGSLKDIQKVVAVGTSVRDIQEGDLVMINPDRYAVRKYKEDSVKADLMTNEVIGYNIPQVEMDGQSYMLLQDRDIVYVIKDWEEVKQDSSVIHQESKIIIP